MIDGRKYLRPGVFGVVGLTVIVALGACGGTQFPVSAPGPTSTVAPAPHAATATITTVMPTLAELGNEWGDDGEIEHSPDVERPPSTCAKFSIRLMARHRVLVHQFAFLPTSEGYESGSASFSVAVVASPSVSAKVLSETASESYRRCALDTAAAWLADQPNYQSMSAERVPLPAKLPGVLWRVRAVFNASDSYYLDIAFLGNDSMLVKARIGVCGCQQQSGADTIVDGEYSALEHIAHSLGLGT